MRFEITDSLSDSGKKMVAFRQIIFDGNRFGCDLRSLFVRLEDYRDYLATRTDTVKKRASSVQNLDFIDRPESSLACPDPFRRYYVTIGADSACLFRSPLIDSVAAVFGFGVHD
ncbi:MAG: hypothetical protein ABIR63_07495 [Sphingomicrobium sp.]